MKAFQQPQRTHKRPKPLLLTIFSLIFLSLAFFLIQGITYLLKAGSGSLQYPFGLLMLLVVGLSLLFLFMRYRRKKFKR